MNRLSTLFLASLCLICLTLPSAAFFGPPTANFVGRVNFIAPTNFTILTDNSQLVRVMLTRDKGLPPEVQLGVVVEVKAVQGDDGQWYLDEFKKINLQPTR